MKTPLLKRYVIGKRQLFSLKQLSDSPKDGRNKKCYLKVSPSFIRQSYWDITSFYVGISVPKDYNLLQFVMR